MKVKTLRGEPLRGYDVRKYFDYFFERRGFTVDTEAGSVSDMAREAVVYARGRERGPALLLHGIMPRCGSVYVGELLRKHPDLYAYPHHLWEIPALQLTPELHRLQRAFVNAYRMNRGSLEDNDFHALFGGALMALIHSATPPEQRAMVKMPSVQYLNHFSSMFPNEHLLVLVRDGRDVVASTLRTWRHLNFVQVCLRWNRSARIVLENCSIMGSARRTGYMLCRFEDAISDPEGFLRATLPCFDLDPERYPYEMIGEIPVIGSSQLAAGTVSWRTFIKAPKGFRPRGYWREWSTLKKLIFKAIAGRSLVALGYSEDLSW